MEKLKNYLKEALGIEVEIETLLDDGMKDLPLFILSNYNLFSTEMFGSKFVLAEVKEETPAKRLRKQLDIIQTTLGYKTIAILKPTEAYNRSRMIEKKIPFVISGKQMYMPDLLIDLKEFGVKPTVKREFMQPAAQLLLLFHLQVESLEGINLKTIAKKLAYNAMTITRAVKFLVENNLCGLQGTKDKFLHFSISRQDLWVKSEQLMTNPIKKTSFYSGNLLDDNLRISNINALSNISDLNPSKVEYYAVKPGYIELLKKEYPLNFGTIEGNICIEEWKYDPEKLSKNDYVDNFSLYLSMKNNSNERIEMALEQIMEETIW